MLNVFYLNQIQTMIRKHSLFGIAFVLFSRDSSTTSCTLQKFIYSEFKTAEVRGQIANSNRLDLLAQLAEHWSSKPKVAGSIPTVVKLNFRLPGVDILREHHQYTLSSEYITPQNITC